MTILSMSERDQWSVDLAALRTSLRHGRVSAAIVSITVIVVGFIALALAPRKYDAEAILVESDATADGIGSLGALGSLASLAATVGVTTPRSTSLSEAIALLTSQSFIGKFIDDMSLKPLLFPSDWNESEKKWKSSMFSSPPSDFDAYEEFVSEVLHVDDDPASGLVTVRVTWKDPTEAADWANALVDRLNVEMRRRAIDNADKTLHFLDKELQATQLVSVQEVIFRLMEVQLNTRAIANAREDYVLRYVDRARPKDLRNYDHPKIWILSIAVLLIGGLLGIAAGIVWGARVRVASDSSIASGS